MSSGTERGGGILSHASVLTVSSYSTRTSPVLRGKWILENLLNAPPPPPPPGVPPLDESKAGETGTLRQQMEEHRKNPACASCHSRMDPLGFGLENFNAIGAWRTQDGKFPVDASGVLPDGRAFQTPAQLKTLLHQDRERSSSCLVEKLLTYSLGRGLERYDRPTVAGIAAKLPSQDYKFLATGFGNREQPPVSDADRSPGWRGCHRRRRSIEMNFLTGKHIDRRTLLKRRGRRDRASGARRHVSGDGRLPRSRRAAWQWCMFPTASS